MIQQLLSSAQEQAERSVAPVRAAALLRIARVWTVFDQEKADRILEQGIVSVQELREPARSILLNQAAPLAAAVSPRSALRLASSMKNSSASVSKKLIFNMLRHGHAQEAIDHLCSGKFEEGYPFSAACDAMRHAKDEERQRQLLRAAIAAWLRDSRMGWFRGSRIPALDESAFLRQFEQHWKVLPRAEALDFLRTAVKRITRQRDRRTNAGFSSVGRVRTARFSSVRESRLFELIGPLRQLAPELAGSLNSRYPQLAAASEQFPNGYYATLRESEPVETGEAVHAARPPNDYIPVGREWIPISGAHDFASSVQRAFEVANALYNRDHAAEGGNKAPCECWPSTNGFRSILISAAHYEGLEAARYLDQVPEGDLRLFAQIEMLAALAGLPGVGSASMPPGLTEKQLKAHPFSGLRR